MIIHPLFICVVNCRRTIYPQEAEELDKLLVKSKTVKNLQYMQEILQA